MPYTLSLSSLSHCSLTGEEELIDDEIFRLTLKREQDIQSEKKIKGEVESGVAAGNDEEIQQALSETGAMWKTYENAKV